MYSCPGCNKAIKFHKEDDFIVRCTCTRFCRLKPKSDTKTENLTKYLFSSTQLQANDKQLSRLILKNYDDSYLISTAFQLNNIITFRNSSKKTADAFDNFINNDKKNLSKEEKDLLYKLKSTSIHKLEEKIQILQSQINCIQFLNDMDF